MSVLSQLNIFRMMGYVQFTTILTQIIKIQLVSKSFAEYDLYPWGLNVACFLQNRHILCMVIMSEVLAVAGGVFCIEVKNPFRKVCFLCSNRGWSERVLMFRMWLDCNDTFDILSSA